MAMCSLSQCFVARDKTALFGLKRTVADEFFGSFVRVRLVYFSMMMRT